MTVSDAAEVAGLTSSETVRYWPIDLVHLRLRPAGNNEERWSDEAILESLREAAIYEFPLTTKAYASLLASGQISGPSVPRIWQRFGNWSAACDAAGVVPGRAVRNNYQSKWTDQDLLQIVRQYLLDPSQPNSAHKFDDWRRQFAPDGPSFQTIRNRFGSWTEVKKRAFVKEENVE
ncbi:hypothetical protein [Aeromicrobium flavum]|nr:hypothetical protein [Aeromicrobium flavum]